MEVWKKFRDSTYEISNEGQVRNFKRNLVLKQQVNKKGYHRISLEINKKKRQFSVYRLVAETFITGELDGLVVDHIDRNKSNNHLSNLRVVEQNENIKNRFFNRDSVVTKGVIEEIIYLNNMGLNVEEIYKHLDS